MKIFSFLSCVASLLVLPNAFAITCNGDVTLPTLNSKVETTVFLPTNIALGEYIELSNPINSDIDSVVGYKIIEIQDVNDANLQIIAIDAKNPSNFLSFELMRHSLGILGLNDFKGFEASLPFGPSYISCN